MPNFRATNFAGSIHNRLATSTEIIALAGLGLLAPPSLQVTRGPLVTHHTVTNPLASTHSFVDNFAD